MSTLKNGIVVLVLFGLFASMGTLEVVAQKADDQAGDASTITKDDVLTKGTTREPGGGKHPTKEPGRVLGVKTPDVKEDESEILRGTLKEVIEEDFQGITESEHSHERSHEHSHVDSTYLLETADSDLVHVVFKKLKAVENLRNAEVELEGNWNKNGNFLVEQMISIVPSPVYSVIRPEIETLNSNGEPIKLESSGPQPTVGERSVLVIPLKFTDVPFPELTIDQIKDTLYAGSTSVNAQLEEMSKRRSRLTGIQNGVPDVTPILTFPHTSDNCPSNLKSAWTTEAKALAQAAGYNPNAYWSVMLIFPGEIPSCPGWGASATLGDLGDPTDKNIVWIQYQSGLDLKLLRHMMIHELGHNLGLMHASGFINCTSALFPQDCQVMEYGDNYSVMGNIGVGTGRHYFNNFHLWQLDWQPFGSKVTYLPQPGNYNLSLFPPSLINKGNQVIKFDLKDQAGAQTGYSVYLEYRRQFLPFDDFIDDCCQNVTKGITIRVAPTNLAAQTNTHLVDSTPSIPSSLSIDPAVEPGQTYANTAYGFTVTARSINPFLGARLTVGLTR